MKYGVAIMNDQTAILLLNWAILPPKLERTHPTFGQEFGHLSCA